MDQDAKICYCFHVTRRKLVNFVRRTNPKVPSQLSECGGAGTGCGWCIPFLKQIHQQADADIEMLTPEEYAKRRAEYIRSGKGKPPVGATPLPEDSVEPAEERGDSAG
jgi:NAD(P)H-nitrite reductase large subunit